MSWCLNFFCAVGAIKSILSPFECFNCFQRIKPLYFIMSVFIVLVKVTEWPPIGKIAAHSAYDMFHGIST